MAPFQYTTAGCRSYSPGHTLCLDTPSQKSWWRQMSRHWSVWAVRLCATLKQTFSIHQIGLKFQGSHGYDRKSWFRRSGNGHKFLYVEDIWRAACVFPLQHKPSSGSKLGIVSTPTAAAQTQPLDGSEENQENSGNKFAHSMARRRGLHSKRRGLWGSMWNQIQCLSRTWESWI